MTYQSGRYSASDDRRGRVIFRRLANLLNLFLLSSLAPIKFLPETLGRAPSPPGLIRQSAQGAAGNEKDEKDIRMLEPGQSIKRELAVGQKHTYQIRLSVDQFLNVVIEQQGIDVLAQVIGPDGKEITEFDSVSDLWEKESASLVATASGDYRLIVQPTQKLAPAGG